ncbi:MAG: 30S ribosome-binding factor RbfA [Patescibacteria group bacterium]
MLNKTPESRSRRLYQIDSLLQHELGTLFSRMLESPLGTLVSISTITVSADLSYAEVKLSILPHEQREEVLKAIQGQLKEIQHELNKRLRLYRVPKLNFIIDETEEQAGKIESLLDSLHRSD